MAEKSDIAFTDGYDLVWAGTSPWVAMQIAAFVMGIGVCLTDEAVYGVFGLILSAAGTVCGLTEKEGDHPR